MLPRFSQGNGFFSPPENLPRPKSSSPQPASNIPENHPRLQSAILPPASFFIKQRKAFQQVPEAFYIILTPHGYDHTAAVLEGHAFLFLSSLFLFLPDIKRIIESNGLRTLEFFPDFLFDYTGTADNLIRSGAEKLQQPGIPHVHIAAYPAPCFS